MSGRRKDQSLARTRMEEICAYYYNSEEAQRRMVDMPRSRPPNLCNIESGSSSNQEHSTDDLSSASSSSWEEGGAAGYESDLEGLNRTTEMHKEGEDSPLNRGIRIFHQEQQAKRRTTNVKRVCRKSLVGRRHHHSVHVEVGDGDRNLSVLDQMDGDLSSEEVIRELQGTVAFLGNRTEHLREENLEMMNQILKLASSNIQLLAAADEAISMVTATRIPEGIVVTSTTLEDSDLPKPLPTWSEDDEAATVFMTHSQNDIPDQQADFPICRPMIPARAMSLPSRVQDATHPHLVKLLAQYMRNEPGVGCACVLGDEKQSNDEDFSDVASVSVPGSSTAEARF